MTTKKDATDPALDQHAANWLQDHARLFTDTQKLPVKLTDEEWADASESAARLHLELGALKAEEVARARMFREAHKERQDEVDRLLIMVKSHKETRSVDVAAHGVLESNELVVVRLDTGEVVSRRAMDSGERERAAQTSLPLPPEPTTDKAAKSL